MPRQSALCCPPNWRCPSARGYGHGCGSPLAGYTAHGRILQDVYKGDYGRFTLGFQGGEIWRDAFAGVGGQPSTNIGIFMTSLRYYPNP